MAGAANNERIDAFIKEVTPGTTPATPAFTKGSFDQLNMTADPRIAESFPPSVGGQRLAIGRNGISVAGQGRGKLIYGEFDTFFESLFQSTFTTNVLVNGTGQVATTIEQVVPQGAGGTLSYLRYRGVEVSTGSLALVARQDASVSFDFIGSGSDDGATAIIAGATYADPTETDIIGSGADIGTVTLSGFTPVPCMRDLTVEFQVSDKEEQPRISSDDACGISRGAMRPVIRTQFYIESGYLDIYNAARNGGEFALTVPIGQVSTKKYELYFPKCEFTKAPMQTAESGPLFLPAEIRPKYDSGIGGTVRLTRAIV